MWIYTVALQAASKIYDDFPAPEATFLDFQLRPFIQLQNQDEFRMIDRYQCLG